MTGCAAPRRLTLTGLSVVAISISRNSLHSE